MPRHRQPKPQRVVTVLIAATLLMSGLYCRSRQEVPTSPSVATAPPPGPPKVSKRPRRQTRPDPPASQGIRDGGGIIAPTSGDPNLLLGNPSRATASVTDRDNYLLERKQYALSYNNADGRPNWVSWRLVSEDLGPEERGQFQTDPDLPEGFTTVAPTDYRGSGYDRGHLCPSGDRTASREANDATFYMSNMMPQAADNNQKSWATLENYCRDLANAGNVLYIVCGPVGKVGTIGRVAAVSVPESTWKVVAVLPRRAAGLAQVSTKTRVFAVIIPNRNGPDIADGDWGKWRVPVRDVEKATGLDFFSRLSPSLQSALETRTDDE
ncbi:MAG: DNA/RNA non-specific endonuclease [Cytophagales bacterium]|nr:DNA/RNA non-specific endonuclease [Armatimonadota bacterium]